MTWTREGETKMSFFMSFLVFIIILPITNLANAAQFVVTNNCSYTVWAAAIPGGGRQLHKGESWILNVPSGTTQGRIWGRTNCMFDTNGTGSCQTGDCNGLLKCQGYGDPPNTLTEFALNQYADQDFFDMSLVDGFNLPMEFSSTSEQCSRVIRCTADIIGQCPPELRVGGGCSGPCPVFNTSQYCCSDSTSSCGPTNYSRFFKDRCPDAYSYPQDDTNATFTCPSNGTNYKVMFCPSNSQTLLQLPEAPSSPPLLQPLSPNKGKKPRRKQLIIIIGTASGICVLLAVVAAMSVLIHKNKVTQNTAEDQRRTKDKVDAQNFIRTYRSTLLSSYSYKDIKKMTGGFKDKLGEGGCGKVYQGRALDGRLVAVKVLDKSGSEGRDFINEVAAVGKIHHHNIIKMFGFCLEGKKKALVYEYMPNGSLSDLLSKQKEDSHPLGMAKLLEIAIGIGHGIEYLHVGCHSRILHLDIKPQNVLLDQNLVPKISDFGLAKIYSRQRSAVTVTGLKGTYGFIAPEIFMRNLGNPSHKSDVYSFGMLLLEMVGGKDRQADMMRANTSTSSSESYFPGWIYSKLNQEKTISAEDGDSLEGEHSSALRKMLMVGIWCIQVNPRDRPSMPMVVEMLSGSVEDIGMPPKPIFSSPPRSKLPSPGDEETNSSSSLPQDNFKSNELNVDDDTKISSMESNQLGMAM